MPKADVAEGGDVSEPNKLGSGLTTGEEAISGVPRFIESRPENSGLNIGLASNL